MLKKEKIAYYKDFKKELEGKDMIIFNYRGVNVVDLTDMRRKIKEKGASLKIVKNSLLKRYMKDSQFEFDAKMYKGMNAVVSIKDDFMTVGKIISDVEKNDKVTIKAGIYDQKEVGSDYVKVLANIPPKEELYGMLVGGLQGVVSNFVYVLDEIAKQKE